MKLFVDRRISPEEFFPLNAHEWLQVTSASDFTRLLLAYYKEIEVISFAHDMCHSHDIINAGSINFEGYKRRIERTGCSVSDGARYVNIFVGFYNAHGLQWPKILIHEQHVYPARRLNEQLATI